MDKVDWNQLRAFLETAETGSLSAAARKLGQSQPTLSRQVAALELALGVTLFERVGKTMALTSTGQELLAHARVMGAAAHELGLAATGRSEAVTGVVSVATDVAEQMIAIAGEKLARQPIAQLEFQLADAEVPVAEQATYDAVLAFNLLHLVTDLPQTLNAAISALKPGGLLISKTPCLNEMNPLIPKLALPLLRAIGKAPPVLCFDAHQLQAAMTAQGLQILAVERHGSKSKDWRVFIVARKPDAPPLAA